MRIDSHQHFWKYDAQTDLWITNEMNVLKQDFLPEDLEPLLKQNGMDGCVVVQSSQTKVHTDFILELAYQYDFIKGVVGWIDLRAPDLEEQLSGYSQFTKLKGFRHVVQAEPAGFLTDKLFIAAVNKLYNHNFTYDVLITHNQLAEAIDFAAEVSDTLLIIDHIAKPLIKVQEIAQWKKNIQSMAMFPNVFCKISGMVTEANLKNWKHEDFIPYLDVVMESFGVDRILYGSDWPVCLLAASYSEQLDIVVRYFSNFPAAVKEKIFGLNAVKFYHLY